MAAAGKAKRLNIGLPTMPSSFCRVCPGKLWTSIWHAGSRRTSCDGEPFSRQSNDARAWSWKHNGKLADFPPKVKKSRFFQEFFRNRERLRHFFSNRVHDGTAFCSAGTFFPRWLAKSPCRCKVHCPTKFRKNGRGDLRRPSQPAGNGRTTSFAGISKFFLLND